MAAQAAAPADLLAMIARLAGRLPSQTRRSEESQQLQQFSTPITLGAVAARAARIGPGDLVLRSEEHTSELQSLMRISYAVFCLKKKKIIQSKTPSQTHNSCNTITTQYNIVEYNELCI